MKYLKAEYNEYFKIEHIRTKFNDYSSFKVVAPMFLKNKLRKVKLESKCICAPILHEGSRILVSF